MGSNNTAEHPFEDLSARGMLTENDRKLLLGEKSYENAQMERRAWNRMRDRIQGGLLDFWLLLHHLPPDQRRQLIMDPTGHLVGPTNIYVDDAEPADVYHQEELNSLVYLLGFAYALADDVNLSFDHLVKLGLIEAAQTLYPAPFGLVEYSVSIETQAGVDVDTVIESIEAGEPISRLEYLELCRLLMDDWDVFVEATADVDVPDIDDLESGEQLSRGESLVFYARSDSESGALQQAVAEDRLHPSVLKTFSP